MKSYRNIPSVPKPDEIKRFPWTWYGQPDMWLHYAAEAGNVELIKEFLADPAFDIERRNIVGSTPLHQATNHPEAIKVLIAAGANLNARDCSGHTALHKAAKDGRLETMQILLEAGADPNAGAGDNWTPLHSAATQYHYEAMGLLLDYGADSSIKNHLGNTPKMMAGGVMYEVRTFSFFGLFKIHYGVGVPASKNKHFRRLV